MFVPSVQQTQLIASPLPEQPSLCDVIQRIAVQVLKDLTLMVALGVPVAFFVVEPSGLALMLSASIVQLAISILFNSVGAFASYQATQQESSFCKTIASLCDWLTAFNFGLFSGFNTQILIHESGHFLMSLILYKNPRPLIAIYPFAGGITQFYKTGLSALGQKLGPAFATCAVLASGPGITLIFSSALLAIGLAVKEKYPQLGKYLIAWSLISFLDQVVYAYSALSADPWNLNHDFVHLSVFGLSPIAAMVGVVAIPIALSLAMYWQTTQTLPSS